MLLLTGGGTLHAQDEPSVSAALSRTEIPIDTTAYLTIIVHGSRSAEIEMVDIENIAIHSGGQSSKMQVINGEISSSITYTYVIQPLQEGNYTLPELNVRVDGKILTTEPITFAVVAEERPPSGYGQQKGDDGKEKLAFLLITGVPDHAYSGEMIPLEIKAYYKRGIRVEIQRLPQITGEAYVLSPFSKEPKQSVEVFENIEYSVISWKTSITPVKEGNHFLTFVLDSTLLLPQKNKRRPRSMHPLFGDSFFEDDFFDSFFGGLEKKNITLKSEKETLRILQLPEQNRPADFSGAIGNFTMEVKGTPTAIEVGDPITLTMVINGEGNFDRVAAPSFPETNGWKTYTPSPHFEAGGSPREGSKTFEQAIVAKQSDITEIPSVSFTFFDPVQDKYVSLTSPPIPLQIRGEPEERGVHGPPPSNTSISTEKQRGEGADPPVMPVELSTGTFTPLIQPLFKQQWFLVMVGFCLFLLLGVAIIQLRRKHLLRHKDSIAAKNIEKRIAENMERMAEAVARDDAPQFMEIMRLTLQLRLSNTWQMESSAITHHDLRERLSSQAPLTEIFAIADEYSYGGARLSQDDMNRLLTIAREELKEP